MVRCGMQMPTLAILYAVFMSVLMFASTRKCLKQRRAYWYVLLGVVHSLVLLLLFVGYWNPGLIRPLGPIAIVLFACCVGDAAVEVRGLLRDIDAPEFGPELNRLHKAMWLTIGVAGELPGYLFGGIAAWRAL
jgi:uncharacterized YccA/Bax inhibitor family protein